MWWGPGNGWGAWLVMSLMMVGAWAVLILLVVWIVRQLTRGTSERERTPGSSTAVAILEERVRQGRDRPAGVRRAAGGAPESVGLTSDTPLGYRARRGRDLRRLDQRCQP